MTPRARAERNVLTGTEVRKEAGLLPEQHNPAIHRSDMDATAGRAPSHRSVGNHIPVEFDATGIQADEAGERSQQRRLPRAARPHHRNPLARCEIQVQVQVEER